MMMTAMMKQGMSAAPGCLSAEPIGAHHDCPDGVQGGGGGGPCWLRRRPRSFQTNPCRGEERINSTEVGRGIH